MAYTKKVACLMCFLSLAVLANASKLHGVSMQKSKVTPIEKVIELLESLSKKVEEEGKVEAAEYDKFACFCKEQADEKLYQIEKSKEKIKTLTAEIDALATEITTLTSEISDLATKISGLEADIEAAVTQRSAEHDKYVTNSTGVSNAISAIERAIKALKDSKDDMKGNAKVDLAQVRAAAGRALMVIPQAKAAATLAQLSEPGQAAGYQYQSNDIIATLEDLKDKFTAVKNDMDLEEFKLKDAFEKKKLGLENEKKFSEQEKAEKDQTLEAKTDDKESAEKDKTQETNDMDADQNFLDVLTADCEKKAGLWDQRSQARAAELTALAKATEVLKEKALPAYSANKKLAGLQKNVIALPKAISKHSVLLLQMQSKDTEALQSAASQKALDFLKTAADRLKSSTLSAIAMRVAASKDHFVKVRGLIKDLLAKLKEDAEAEAEQKSFCDTEMGKAIGNRDKANAGVEECLAEIQKLTTEKDTLTQEIVDLTQKIADLKKALLEATELRAKEKTENEETVETATQGKTAVELALSVLKEFYDGAAAGFLQKYVPPNSDREGKTVGDLAPKTFDEEYKGSQGESGGIIGILEVILSDFGRTITTTNDEEETAQSDFEDFESDTKTDIAQQETDIKTKKDRVTEIEDELIAQEDTLKDNETMLGKAKEELEKLEKMCVGAEESYEERVAARKKEIEALKEALAILEES